MLLLEQHFIPCLKIKTFFKKIFSLNYVKENTDIAIIIIINIIIIIACINTL